MLEFVAGFHSNEFARVADQEEKLADSGEWGATMRGYITAASLLPLICMAFSQVSSADQGGATLVGHVTFRGTVPSPRVISVDRDQEFCGSTLTAQPLLVHGPSRGVADAVVSVEGPDGEGSGGKGLSGASGIANHRCAFIPRINAVMVGTVLEIRNEDPILHNTHIRRGRRTFLNVAMVPGGRPVQKPLKSPGVLAVQCDAHKFMTAFVLVYDHPFFGVTNEVGEFRITGLPPGRHVVTVWHEQLGTLKKEVLFPQGEEVVMELEYK